MSNINTSKSRINPLLHSMFHLQQQVDHLLSEQTGLGLSAYRILSVIDDRVPSSQRKIAVKLGQTEANISRQIRTMADENLVKIAPDKKDKRQRNITRTVKGEKKYRAAEALLIKKEPSILKTLKV